MKCFTLKISLLFAPVFVMHAGDDHQLAQTYLKKTYTDAELNKIWDDLPKYGMHRLPRFSVALRLSPTSKEWNPESLERYITGCLIDQNIVRGYYEAKMMYNNFEKRPELREILNKSLASFFHEMPTACKKIDEFEKNFSGSNQ